MKKLKRGKLTWLIYKDKIIVYDNIQATIYHLFGAMSQKPLDDMKKKLYKSKDNEYSDWVKAISLSMETGVRGYGTKRQADWT